jgi:hypothetical protein
MLHHLQVEVRCGDVVSVLQLPAVYGVNDGT